jgi:serine/threonine protein kinase
MAICERTLTEEQIAIVLKQSLYGLEYLHAKRKIHRDIKSGNILINHDGDCKVRRTHTSTATISQGTQRVAVVDFFCSFLFPCAVLPLFSLLTSVCRLSLQRR